MKVAVLGAGGYVGGSWSPACRSPRSPDPDSVSRTHAGRTVATSTRVSRRSPICASPALPRRGRAGCDAVFLASTTASRRRSWGLLAAGPGLVCDLSADFDCGSLELHERTYGRMSPPTVGGFVYALADVLGPELRGVRRLAAPAASRPRPRSLSGRWPGLRRRCCEPVRRDGLERGGCPSARNDSPSGARPQSLRVLAFSTVTRPR